MDNQLEKEEIAQAIESINMANRAMARLFNLEESEGDE